MDIKGFADGTAGPDVGVERSFDLACRIKADGGDLYDFIRRRVGPRAFDVEDDNPFFCQGCQQETVRVACFLGNGVDEVAEPEAQAAVGFAFDGFDGPPADAGDETQENPLQTQVVMLVEQQPEIGQDVFTFLSLEQVELVDAGDGQLLL